MPTNTNQIPRNDRRTRFFSPDSQWIGFFVRGTLRKLLVAGGAPVTVAAAPGIFLGADWGKDDTIVYAGMAASGNSSLWRVSAEGGTAAEIRQESFERVLLPHVLPDGRTVLFTLESANDPPRIAALSLDSGERRILLEGSNARYLPTGHLVYARTASLMAVPFEPNRVELLGSPVPVLENIRSPLWGGTPIPQYSISNTGSLLYAPGRQVIKNTSRLVRVDRTGEAIAITKEASGYAYPRMSPDGERVAVSIQTKDGRSIWLVDIARDAATRFTFEKTQFTLAWTPTGDRLSYQSSQGIFWKPVDGSANEEPLVEDAFWPSSWSPDGKMLAYTKTEFGGDIWVLPREPDAEPIPVARSEFNEVGAVFSRDGHFIAYVSDESGRNEVYVQPYPGPGEKKLVSTDGGVEPVWSRDGRELFYRNGDKLLAVTMGAELGQPEVLFEKAFHPTLSPMVGAANYDVSADGAGFIMLAFDEERAPAAINVVLNWFDELEQLVPIED